jgi:hypothetical protein
MSQDQLLVQWYLGHLTADDPNDRIDIQDDFEMQAVAEATGVTLPVYTRLSSGLRRLVLYNTEAIDVVSAITTTEVTLKDTAKFSPTKPQDGFAYKDDKAADHQLLPQSSNLALNLELLYCSPGTIHLQ